jgi:methyltransferase NSUN6
VAADDVREEGLAALQNLPSTVAAAVLDAQPGMKVLDMCAAPGGKTCAIADAMKNKGEIIAFDRTAEKAANVSEMAKAYGYSCIKAYKKDATGILKLSDEVKSKWAMKVRPRLSLRRA